MRAHIVTKFYIKKNGLCKCLHDVESQKEKPHRNYTYLNSFNRHKGQKFFDRPFISFTIKFLMSYGGHFNQHFSYATHIFLDRGSDGKRGDCTYTMMKMKIFTSNISSSPFRSKEQQQLSGKEKKYYASGWLTARFDVLNSGAFAQEIRYDNVKDFFLYVFEKFHFFLYKQCRKSSLFYLTFA